MLTMYSTPWCGYCRRLKTQLDREAVDYREVDISTDASAADYVMRINNGNQTVPTLRFTDGTALTNPTIDQVRRQLTAASN